MKLGRTTALLHIVIAYLLRISPFRKKMAWLIYYNDIIWNIDGRRDMAMLSLSSLIFRHLMHQSDKQSFAENWPSISARLIEYFRVAIKRNINIELWLFLAFNRGEPSPYCLKAKLVGVRRHYKLHWTKAVIYIHHQSIIFSSLGQYWGTHWPPSALAAKWRRQHLIASIICLRVEHERLYRQ